MHEFTVLCRATTYVDFGERGLTEHKKASTKQIGMNKKTNRDQQQNLEFRRKAYWWWPLKQGSKKVNILELRAGGRKKGQKKTRTHVTPT